MSEELSLLSRYTHHVVAFEKGDSLALWDHPQIPFILDILSRKESSPILLTGFQSEKIQSAFLDSLATHFNESTTPKSIRGAKLIYLDIKRLTLHEENTEEIKKTFLAFCTQLKTAQEQVIFVVNQLAFIPSMLLDSHWRIILVENQKYRAGFITVKVAEPSETQSLAILKSFKSELEEYHDVMIPEETLVSALSMAQHYLPSYSWFDKACELLDSAAARTSTMEKTDAIDYFKPVVTRSELAHIVSNCTHIPVTHLNNNPFQLTKFIESLQRRIFGQEAAITMIGTVLQHACIKLQEKTGPLCSFLLAGSAETGKTSVALAMAEHLFGHKDALIRVNLNEACLSIADVKILSEESLSTSLLTAIRQTPYAVILIENIQQWPAATFNLFKHIFLYGFAVDNDGNKYDFSHAIFVMTTTLGSERIAALTQAPPVHETNKSFDLMQLVLSDHSQDAAYHSHHISSQELCEELIPILEGYFSTALLQHFHIIPFVPVEYSALEKIIRLKVKLFAKRLESNFGIELNYAPEVIKFLAHEALWRKVNIKPLEKLLEEYLYSAVANEILAHAEDKNPSKRLLLQLNDEGQLLRCEFMSAVGASIYSL